MKSLFSSKLASASISLCMTVRLPFNLVLTPSISMGKARYISLSEN